MATTATISVSPTVVNNGQVINVTLTLTSPPGDTARQLLRVEPYFLNGQSPTAGAAAYSGNANIVIGGSTMLSPTATAAASLPFAWQTQAYAPPSPLNPAYPSTPAYDVFTIGAVAYFGDGTTASASASIFVYPLIKDSTFVLTTMPGVGGLRHDSNLESALLAAEQAATAFPATVSAAQSMTFFNLATTGRA